MKADPDNAEISLFDEIGAWGVTVGDFKKELDAVKDAKAITLYLNSVGGDVFAAKAIYSLLAPMKERITVRTLGLAASAAAAIALVGKTHIMSEGAYFMIHNAWTFMLGNAAELRKTAGLLDAIDGDNAAIYQARSNKTIDEIKAMMAAETWLTAEEAVAMGFADEVEEAEQIAALADLSKFNYQHVPKAVMDRVEKKDNPPATARDFERLLRDSGFSRKVASAITAKGFTAVSSGMEEAEDSGIEPVEDAAPIKVMSIERKRELGQKLRLALAS
jgi:ATP-dependent protease ClpP protease subunit